MRKWNQLELWQELWLRIAACLIERPDGVGDLTSLINLMRPACQRVEELRETVAEMERNPVLAADPLARELAAESRQLIAALEAARLLCERRALADPPPIPQHVRFLLSDGVWLALGACESRTCETGQLAKTIATLSNLVAAYLDPECRLITVTSAPKWCRSNASPSPVSG